MTGVRNRSGFGHIAKLFALALTLTLAAQAEAQFKDPLDTPALMRTHPDKRPLMAIVQAGDRLIAAGPRGMVIGSDDRGKTWTQAKTPVQSDLLAVNFPTAKEGWIVGHEGVILRSEDGGKTWQKQLDGRAAVKIFKDFYQSLGAEGAAASAQLDQNYKAGPVLPFLDVWFEDTQNGYAVGSFGMLIATHDGGKTWEPWLHKIDNPQYLNLNAVRGIGTDIYIAGEHGQVYRLDRAKGRFTKVDTGYNGSFFGIVGNNDTLVAFGLRGTVYRSYKSGGGNGRWDIVAMPNEHTLSSGSAMSNGAGFILVNAAGQLLVSDKDAKQFQVVTPAKSMRMTGIVVLDAKTAVITGFEGVSTETLSDAAPPQH